MQKLSLALLTTTTLMVVGCAATPKLPTLPQGNYHFDLTDRSVPRASCPTHLKVGQTITVKVYDNPSTGYSWKLGELQHIQAELSYIQKPPSSGPVNVGAGRDTTWIFTAQSVGQAHIRLYHSPGWEQVKRAAWQCQLSITE